MFDTAGVRRQPGDGTATRDQRAPEHALRQPLDASLHPVAGLLAGAVTADPRVRRDTRRPPAELCRSAGDRSELFGALAPAPRPLGATSPLRRSASPSASAAPVTPTVGAWPAVLRRAILDPSVEDEVIDVEIAKRQAQVANMNLGRGRIAQHNPERQNIEAFFADPANRKGDRSYPAVGPGVKGDRGPRADGAPTAATTTLPGVLVVGPDASSRLPEQATGEQEIQDHYRQLTVANPLAAGLLDPILREAMTAIEEVGRHGVRKVTHGAGQDGDVRKRGEKITGIVTGFKRDASRAVEQQSWEGTVTARNDFINGKEKKEMAARALERAGQDIGRAGAIYDSLYQPIAFDEERVARLASTSSERQLIGLSGVIPPAAWAALLSTITASDELIQFAIAHQPALTGVANAALVVPVWHANPAHITSVADVNAILALNLVQNDVAKGIDAASVLGTVPVPDIAALTVIDGQVASIKNVKTWAAIGGDVLATKGIRALPEAPKLEVIQTFYAKAGRTKAEAQQSWTDLTTHVTDDQKKSQIVQSVAKAEKATLADFNRIVTNWATLGDRTTVNSATVAQLVTAGILLPVGSTYTSTEWGRGATYFFTIGGQGRLTPEWHIHFKFDKKDPTVVGAGWKNQSQKHTLGVKTFDQAATLQKAIRDTNKWIVVR